MTIVDLVSDARNCPICSSSSLTQLSAVAHDTMEKGSVNIIECQHCAFAWQFPLARTLEQSIDEFDRNYQAQGQRLSDYFAPSRKEEIAALELAFLSSLPLQGRRLLDIGAGSGEFSRLAAKNGFLTTALDPALQVERFAESDAVNAVRGSLQDLGEGERFDAISMWDVIEHLPDPIANLADACQRLEPDGWIVIETGNYKSVDRARDGVNHWIYQLDHRWYFSPDSLEKVLRTLGFSEFIHCDRALRPNWSGDIHFRGPSQSQLLWKLVKRPHRVQALVKEHLAMAKASQWPRAGIPIFCIAARR